MAVDHIEKNQMIAPNLDCQTLTYFALSRYFVFFLVKSDLLSFHGKDTSYILQHRYDVFRYCVFLSLLDFSWIFFCSNMVLRGFQTLSVVFRYLDVLLLTQDMHFWYYKTFNLLFFIIVTQCLKGLNATLQFMSVVLNKFRYIKLLRGDVLQIVIMQLYCLVMSLTRFRVNPHSIVSWMSRNSLLEAGAKSEV